jgi:hypothetical protein
MTNWSQRTTDPTPTYNTRPRLEPSYCSLSPFKDTPPHTPPPLTTGALCRTAEQFAADWAKLMRFNSFFDVDITPKSTAMKDDIEVDFPDETPTTSLNFEEDEDELVTAE